MRRVMIYTTIFNEDGVVQKMEETGLTPDTKEQEMWVVNLYPQKEYQVIEGFGAALTEAAGYTLARMSEEKRREVVEAYYGKDGIGYTLGRLSMDSCDFSVGHYCAVEREDDPEFRTFSLERDAKYVQPMVKLAAKALGGPVGLLLSPWSPPAFMKETGARNGGGRLKKECYQSYADYMVKYIQAYRKAGMPIRFLTVQNEPLALQTWDSCEYTAGEEKTFIREYLYPALQAAGLAEVGIYVWDHNKERLYERVCDIVDDTTRGMIAGAAFHWYTGDHFETLQMVREDFPELKLMHSEGCTTIIDYEKDGAEAVNHVKRYAHDIIGDLNHGMNSWIDWNLTLDEQGGPNHVENYCSAPIMCDTTTDTVFCRPTYYAVGHFSKYIRPGAVRVGSSSFAQDLEVTAAKNPDGTCVMVMLNASPQRKMVQLRTGGDFTRFVAPGNSISTLVIPGVSP